MPFTYTDTSSANNAVDAAWPQAQKVSLMHTYNCKMLAKPFLAHLPVCTPPVVINAHYPAMTDQLVFTKLGHHIQP